MTATWIAPSKWPQLRRWQPYARPRIDWTHPLAAKLALSTYNCASDAAIPPFNYVNGKIGTRVGGLTTATARGTSQGFDGTSANTSTIPFSLSPNVSASCAFWLYWTAFASDNQSAFSCGGNLDGSGFIGFGLVPNSVGGGLLSFIGQGDGSHYALNRASRPALAPGWMHLAMTIDLTASALQVIQTFVNGRLIIPDLANTNGITSYAWNGTILNLGQYNGTGTYGNCALQNFCIWARALKQSEIIQHMTMPYALFLRAPPVGNRIPPANAFHPWTMMPNGWLS